MDDSTKYRKLKDLGGKQPEPGYAYIVEPDETGRTIAVDGSWAANLPPWATSTAVCAPYAGGTHAGEILWHKSVPSPPYSPTPLTTWEKILLFFKLFFTGRS